MLYPSQQPCPCPVRKGPLESLSPKPHGPLSKDRLAAVLGEGSAGAACHRNCPPKQTPHPATTASPICSPFRQISPPGSLLGVFVVHKHLLTPICAPITQGQHGVIAFHSLLAHKLGKAVWVLLLRTNTNVRHARVTAIAARLTRRCLPEEQLFIRIFAVHLVLWGNKAGNAYSRLIIRNRLEESAAAAAGVGAHWSQCLHGFQLASDHPSPWDNHGGMLRWGTG